MEPHDESELRSRLAEAESLGDAIRNNEIDAIVGSEQILVLRMLELGREHSDILDNLPDVLFRLDTKGLIHYISPAISIYAGLNPSDCLRRDWREFNLPGEAVDTIEAKLASLHREKTPQSFIFSTRTKQGLRHLQTRLFLQSKSGEPTDAVLGIVTDVSQQHDANQRLERNEERLRTAIEGANLGTFEFDLDSQEFVHWNQRMTELYGFESPQNVTPAEAFQHIHPEDCENLRQTLARTSQQSAFECTHRVCRPSGKLRWIHLSGRILVSGEERSSLVIGVATDVTAQKTVEASLQAAAEAARESNRRKSDFIASMSHEVRTPLTGILGFADILDQQQDPEIIQEGIASIRENGKFLSSIINNVLDLSKLEAGKTSTQISSTKLRVVIDQVLSLMQGAAQKHTLRLTSEFAENLPEAIQTDPERLKQVLLNLVSNAIKFTDEGEVRISASLDDSESRLHISVSDTGSGIDPEFQKKLFEPFEQEKGKYDDTEEPGTGLGLAISKQLAAALGGQLELVHSDPNGSTFRVNLPLDPERAETTEPDASDPGEAAATAVDQPLAEHRILVVEDEKTLRSVLTHCLRHYGCEAKVVASGEEALKYVDEHGGELDAVLLDIRLPGMDGLEVVRELRTKGFDKPVIALTAHAGSMSSEQCLEAGCTDFLLKPFEHKKLIGALVGAKQST